jgi:DNA topoisomerase-1
MFLQKRISSKTPDVKPAEKRSAPKAADTPGDRRAEDARDAARSEGLRYVDIRATGFTRKRRGKSFQFFDQDGHLIRSKEITDRIKAIGIPPAYEDVWISPWANGHIQAVGHDARGRKQYRYHTRWREVRDKDKFEHILEFGKALPAVRRRVSRDLGRPDMDRAKVLAVVVSLLEKTLIRVGNSEYAKQNDSYGLTTLRRKHVDVTASHVRFHFVGKSGKKWDIDLADRRLARAIKNCSDLPGHDLFKYVDADQTVRTVSSNDVNEYLREIAGEDFTAKDFRTWFGTVLAAIALTEFKKYDSQSEAKKNIVAAIEKVSKQLGNTPAICRKCYVHPEIVDAYMSGETVKAIEGTIEKKLGQPKSLSSDEVMVLAFLQRRLKAKGRKTRA